MPSCLPPTRFVCVGRLVEQKGQLLLIEAAGRLKKEGLAFELVLVGDGPLRGEIERLIDRHDLRDVVTVTGWMSNADVRAQILASQVFVLPSFAEGLPVAIMEALALGRPVLTTAIAGIPELVLDGQCGWIVSAGSIEALVEAMRQALNADQPTLAEMGETGAQRVRERHDVRKEAAKLKAFFEEQRGTATERRSDEGKQHRVVTEGK